ncbi:MAG: glycosyltransferase family 4 protein [Flavobacterium sp.]|nr:glycosyltransferase family 4 protein [Flavobacterium sp.]HQV36233.1 glycosyltransferase family 4 protein [Flavobacterium sp.]HQX04524.1 glycosyltransferase family 4 protein [Flavobacterium sp.]
MRNIILLTSEFPPLPGGIGTHALQLAMGLSQNGYMVTVITDRRSDDWEKEDVFDTNLSFKVIRIARKRFGRTYWNRILQTIFQIIKGKQQTVIGSGKFSLWTIGFVSLFFRNNKYLGVIHGTELRAGGSISKLLTKLSLKKCSKLIAVSNFTKNKILDILPLAKVVVINNGVVLPTITEEVVEKELGISLVTVGNLTRRKGQHNVINALPEILKSNCSVHYHCIGILSELDKNKALALKMNVIEDVTFHGVLSDNDMYNQMQRSHIFMMLSENLSNGDFEGFGIAVLEANALGLPAIGSKNSGIADAIKDGFNGKLVSPQNPVEIKEAILEILNNYNSYSIQAKQWALQSKWEYIIPKYINVLEE